MAYQTGTASSVVDLLDKFRGFAQAQGWTVNRWTDLGFGKQLCISKGASFFNFRAHSAESVYVNGHTSTYSGILLNGSDGYDGALSWDRQPGYPRAYVPSSTDQKVVVFPMTLNVGPFPAYHFFDVDGKTLYAEVEFMTGTFMRFGCGALDIFNPSAPGGGRFCYGVTSIVPISPGFWLNSNIDEDEQLEFYPFRGASYSSSAWGASSGAMVRALVGSVDNWAASGGSSIMTTSSSAHGGVYTSGMRLACTGGAVHDKILMNFSPNPLNGVAVLLPNIVGIYNSPGISPVGVVPGMRHLDITNYLPGDEITFGGDTWKVFPWYQKGGISLQRGIAYKKVV